MKLRQIKHAVLRLSAEEKVVGLGGLTLLLGSFMPWYSVVMNFEKTLTYNAYAGDLGIIGFVVVLMSGLALLTLLAETLHIRLPQFGYSKEQTLFFLMGQSLFLVLLDIAIYTKRSLEFTQAELRFGIYVGLAGGFLGAFAAFAQIQKAKEKSAREFFGQEEAPQGGVAEEGAFFGEEDLPSLEHPIGRMEEENEPEPLRSYGHSKLSGQASPQEHPGLFDRTPRSSGADQGDYFTKEAGLR